MNAATVTVSSLFTITRPAKGNHLLHITHVVFTQS